jgi:hypothetical protein
VLTPAPCGIRNSLWSDGPLGQLEITLELSGGPEEIRNSYPMFFVIPSL